MGMFDWVHSDDPRFVCSEGHRIVSMQTKDCDCTLGTISIDAGGRVTQHKGPLGFAHVGPMNETLEVYGDCDQCPALVQAKTLNLCSVGVDFDVTVENDIVTRVHRASPTTAEHLAKDVAQPYMAGCAGPMPYADAMAIHVKQKPFPVKP